MAPDPRTPVLVGVGQLTRHPATVDDCPEPTALMEQAARRAGDDSGTGDALLRRADSVQVVDLMAWRYADPGRALAGRLGATPRETARSTVGGNSPQMLVNEAALAIAAGTSDVVLIAGCEAIHSRLVARKTGGHLDWPTRPEGGPGPDRVVGTDRPGVSDAEQARSLVMPVQIYPVFENALRLAAGESCEDHQRRVSELWGRFSDVATRNPHAWDPTPHTATEIRTVSPANRMVGWPYPKLMTANIQVDMAAALVLTSVAAARTAGVPEDRWIFPWSGADSHDHWLVSERWDLHSSPSMAANGRAALGLAGIGIDDVSHMDLYSCFPSAVQMGCAALGIDADDPARVPTVTGGLTFGGGPGNSYATHSIAAMADVLRRDPGSVGLVTALGWYATKHSIGVYSTRPPNRPFGHAHPQEEVNMTPSRPALPEHSGPVSLESWTVMHERDGEPSLGIVACLSPEGGRAWANTRHPDLLAALEVDDLAGRSGTLGPDGELDVR